MRRFLILLFLFSADLTADPESHYMIHCMGCHLADGAGLPPEVPAFGNQLGRFAQTDRGRAYLIRVPGAAQSPINDQALADVINWMLYRYSAATLPEDFRPFDEDEVARHRENILKDPQRLRKTLEQKS